NLENEREIEDASLQKYVHLGIASPAYSVTEFQKFMVKTQVESDSAGKKEKKTQEFQEEGLMKRYNEKVVTDMKVGRQLPVFGIVLQPLGKGAFGNVFLVFKDDVGIVAAKVMKEEDFDTTEWKAGLTLSREDQNPFVLKYHSTTMDGNNAVIVMEYANCGNLQNLINKNIDIPIPIIRVIMKQLLEGLRLMHEKGLIHRDIKGENVMLHSPQGSGRMVIKITDFGLAKVQKQPFQSTLMTIAGTLTFMSPELVMGKEDQEEEEEVKADAKVDVWSIGILLHLLAAHKFPFEIASPQAITKFMYSKKLIRPPTIVDDQLWDLITKMLNFDRKQRISSAEALQHEFFTGQIAIQQISLEAKQLAQIAWTAQRYGDQNINKYETNISFTLPLSVIKQIAGF
ncbi:MAG: putative CAMK family protein kinase, partial [Streblomastix strix]